MKKMLATACLLLPAIVVGAAVQQPMRAVAGQWTTTVEDGVEVVTHDASKWTAANGFPLALFDPPRRFEQGTAALEFKLIGADDDYSAGLVFGYQPSGAYYFVRYNTKDGNVALWRMEGGTRSVVKHGELHEQLTRGAWHQLRLEVDGRVVRGTVNGRWTVEHTFDEAPSGLLGLWTKATATSAFRNLSVAPR